VNPSTKQALDRLLAKMDRPRRRPRRVSTAPIVLALGLLLGYQLLVRFVPMAWSILLPGGLDQAARFRGWPGLLWRVANMAYGRYPASAIAFGSVGLAGVIISVIAPPLRFLVWLAAIAVIALDAAIVVAVVTTAVAVTAQEAGLGGL